MAALLKFLFQAIACLIGFIVAVAIVIVIHKKSEQEALAQTPNESAKNTEEVVSYNPRQQLEAQLLQSAILATRGCLRQMQAVLLHQNIRNRNELIERSSEMCKSTATRGVSGDSRSAMLASLTPWAVYELEMILKYGTSHIRVETIPPN